MYKYDQQVLERLRRVREAAKSRPEVKLSRAFARLVLDTLRAAHEAQEDIPAWDASVRDRLQECIDWADDHEEMVELHHMFADMVESALERALRVEPEVPVDVEMPGEYEHSVEFLNEQTAIVRAQQAEIERNFYKGLVEKVEVQRDNALKNAQDLDRRLAEAINAANSANRKLATSWDVNADLVEQVENLKAMRDALVDELRWARYWRDKAMTELQEQYLTAAMRL